MFCINGQSSEESRTFQSRQAGDLSANTASKRPVKDQFLEIVCLPLLWRVVAFADHKKTVM